MRNPAAPRPGRPILPLAAALLAAVALAPGARAQTAQRGVEPVIVKGSKLAGWTGPPAAIVCDLFPAGGSVERIDRGVESGQGDDD